MGALRYSQEEIIAKFRIAHGEFYSYDKAIFRGTGRRVTITCPKHGDFEQVVSDHIGGHGCWKCHQERSKTWTQEQDDFLIKNYRERGVTHCALSLKRNNGAVASRALQLGIAKTRPVWEYKICPSFIWGAILHRVQEKGYDLTITPTNIEELYISQQQKCALSGLPIIFGEKSTSHNTASVDRIDSSKGYIIGNIQLVHKDVNRMKNEFSDSRFFEICHNVSAFRKQDFIERKTTWEDDWQNETVRPTYTYILKSQGKSCEA